MKSNNLELVQLFEQYQLQGIDIVNELMRFKVLDQLLSANASAREWGLRQMIYMLWRKNPQ